MQADEFERHDLVFAPATAGGDLPHAIRPAWEDAGRPLIVRRGGHGAEIPLGLPLPPSMGKGRLCLSHPPSHVVRMTAPTLAEIAGHAPAGWRPTLRAAEAVARDRGVRVTAYGALLWQALLGLDYLHPGSDLDLLWTCPEAVPSGLPEAIARLATRAPMRLDGEILSGGWAVQWRELHGAAPGDRVLGKSCRGVEMRAASRFLVSAPA